MNKRVLIAGLAIATGAILTGCQTVKINPTAGGGGIAGNWVPDGGGYTATFDNGRFFTTALDTGNTISQGSYVAVSEKQVDLTWRSNITGLENQASCQRPEPQVMQCVDAGNKQFTLRKG